MRSRPIFTEAAIAACEETDQPIHALDPATGIRLIYRFDDVRGGVLTCYGGPLSPDRTSSQAVAIAELNGVAADLCDRLAHAYGLRR
ncbi:MAG: hypothetical protein GC150_07310 [Rhizobiales bacterium]|nr:hypothetical protein [Hyphomicrobiales bacterium]